MTENPHQKDTRYKDAEGALRDLANIFGEEGNAIINLLLPWLKMFTGNDVVWDTIFTTNAGKVGLFNEYQNRQLTRMRTGISKDFQREQLRQHIDSLERTLWSSDNYDPSANNGVSYDDYIKRLVDNKMSKGGLRWIYEQFVAPTDWDDSWTVGQNLGNVAYSQARRTMLRGDTYGLAFGKYLAANIFTGAWDNDAGNFIQKDTFKAKDWGEFTRKGVSELASVLAENTDFYKGVTGNTFTDWRSAIDRFRQTLKDYTEALAPLKDIMGNDTAKMVKAMESITGQRFSTMSPEHIASLANDLAVRSISGQWTMREYTGMLTDVTKGLAQMTNISPWNYISAPKQAMQAMDIVSGTARPSFLTDSQWRASARERVLQTNNSKATELFAKSYALWAEQAEQQAPGADRSFNAFMRKVRDMAGAGGDFRVAARELANAPYDYLLNSAMASPYYRDAMLTGQAGALDRMAYTQQMRKMFSRFIGMDTAFMSGVGIDVNAEDAPAEARNVFGQVLDLVYAHSELMQMPEVRRARYMRDILGVSGDVNMLSRAMSYMENNNAYNPLLVALSADANERDTEKYIQAYRRRAELVKALDATIYDSDEGIRQLFSGGWSNRRLIERLTSSKMIGDTQSLDASEAMISASGILGEKIYGTAEKDSRARAELSRNLYAYSVSTEAKSNIGFLNTLDKYNELYKRIRGLDENSEEYKKLMPDAQRLSTLLLAYKEAGNSVDEFMASDIWENGVKLSGEAAETAKYRRISEFIANSKSAPGKDNKVKRLLEHFKYARMDNLMEAYEGDDRQRIHNLYSDFIEYQRKNDTDNMLALTERWNEFYNDKMKSFKENSDKEALEKLNKLVRETDSTAGTDMNYQDRLLNVLEALEKLLADIKGKVFGE